MKSYEEQIKQYSEDFNHDFQWQNFDDIKPPKRGYYEILHDDNGELHLTNAYYSEIFDSWVLYPFWIEKGTLKFWSPTSIDPDELNENGEIISNIEDNEDTIEMFDFLDVKASVISDLEDADKYREEFPSKRYNEIHDYMMSGPFSYPESKENYPLDDLSRESILKNSYELMKAADDVDSLEKFKELEGFYREVDLGVNIMNGLSDLWELENPFEFSSLKCASLEENCLFNRIRFEHADETYFNSEKSDSNCIAINFDMLDNNQNGLVDIMLALNAAYIYVNYDGNIEKFLKNFFKDVPQLELDRKFKRDLQDIDDFYFWSGANNYRQNHPSNSIDEDVKQFKNIPEIQMFAHYINNECDNWDNAYLFWQAMIKGLTMSFVHPKPRTMELEGEELNNFLSDHFAKVNAFNKEISEEYSNSWWIWDKLKSEIPEDDYEEESEIKRVRHEISKTEEDILRQYLETLNVSLLESISNKSVAYTIDVILKEAIRTWEEDDLSMGMDDEGNFTGNFQTDYELFNPELVFFGESNWDFPITIYKNDEQHNTNWDNHNYFYPRPYEYINEDGLLCNFYQDIDIFGTEKTWKWDLLKSLFMVVYAAYEYWEELKK